MKVTMQFTVDFSKATVSSSECKGESSKGQWYINGHKLSDVKVVSGAMPKGAHFHLARQDSGFFFSADSTFVPVQQATVQQTTLPPHLAALGALTPEQLAAIIAAVTGTPVQQTAPVQQPVQQTAPVQQVNAADALFDRWKLPEAVRDSVKQMVSLAKTASDDKQLRNSVATTIKCFGDFRLSNEAWNTLKSSV